PLQLVPQIGDDEQVRAIAFRPDGKTVAAAAKDGAVKLWDVASGYLVRTLPGHTGAVLSVAFSPDGGILASGSSDETVKLWDLTDGHLLRTLKGTLDGFTPG